MSYEQQLSLRYTSVLAIGALALFATAGLVNTPPVSTLVGYIAVAVVGAGLTSVVVIGGVIYVPRAVTYTFGIYLIGLCLLAIVAPTPRLPLYIMSSIIIFTAAFVVLPPALLQYRTRLLGGLIILGVGLTFHALSGLILETLTPSDLRIVGNTVLGVQGLRIRGLYRNSNVFSLALLPSVIAVCTLTADDFRNRRARLRLTLPAAAIIGFGFLLGGSEAGYIAASLALVVILAAWARNLLLPYLLACSIGVIGIAMSGYANDFLTTGLHGRTYLWVASIQQIIDQPLLGIRFTDLPTTISQHLPPERADLSDSGSHNVFLQSFVMTGIVVGGFYAAGIIFATVRAVRAVARKQTPTRVFVAALAVALVFDMCFRQQTIGGLSTGSIVIAVSLGLAFWSGIEN